VREEVRDDLRVTVPTRRGAARRYERGATGHGSTAGGRAFDGPLFRLLALLDDVTFSEQDPLGDLAPRRRSAQEELETHAELPEVLARRIANDRSRFAIGLDREALLVQRPRASSVSDAQSRANVRVSSGSSFAARGIGRIPQTP